jgi:hypothetical protein
MCTNLQNRGTTNPAPQTSGPVNPPPQQRSAGGATDPAATPNAPQGAAQSVAAAPNGTVTCDVNEPLLNHVPRPILQGHDITGTLRPAISTDDTWAASGCHPTCLVMITRWWVEQNRSRIRLRSSRDRAGTEGEFNAELSGPSVAHDLWGGWQPGARRTPAATGPVVPYLPVGGTYATATSWRVDHEFIRLSMRRLVLRKDDGSYENLETGTVRCGTLNRAAKRALVQSHLLNGPIVLNMTHPAHNVLVYGYRAGRIYIADPGLIIQRWGHRANAPADKVKCNDGGRGYVELDESYVFTFDRRNDQGETEHINMPWIQSVDYLEWFRFPSANVGQRPC